MIARRLPHTELQSQAAQPQVTTRSTAAVLVGDPPRSGNSLPPSISVFPRRRRCAEGFRSWSFELSVSFVRFWTEDRDGEEDVHDDRCHGDPGALVRRAAEGGGGAEPGGGCQDRPQVRGRGGGGRDGAGRRAGDAGAVAGAGPAVVPAGGRHRRAAGVLAGDRGAS